jgi:hypothetical protein
MVWQVPLFSCQQLARGFRHAPDAPTLTLTYGRWALVLTAECHGSQSGDVKCHAYSRPLFKNNSI